MYGQIFFEGWLLFLVYLCIETQEIKKTDKVRMYHSVFGPETVCFWCMQTTFGMECWP